MNFFQSGRSKVEDELDPSGAVSPLGLVGLCALGLAAALVIAPQFFQTPEQEEAELDDTVPAIDYTTTAGVPAQKDGTKIYFESRSILNKDPSKPCIVPIDGKRSPRC